MGKWKMVKLEEVCEILDSMRVPVTASDRKSGIYPYYGANGVQGYVSEHIFDDELVLLAEDGGNFDSKTRPIAYRVSGKCWVNNHAHVLKAKPTIDVNYLCYSIMFYDVSKIISGTTRAKLNQAAMRKMTIPLPPLEAQNQITRTLDTAAQLLAIRKQQLAELDKLIKSTFYDMFGDPIANEKKWEVKTLKEVCNKITDGTHYSPDNFNVGPCKYITAKNIKKDGFDLSNLTYITKEIHRGIYSRCNPKFGDVLYIKDGVTTGIAQINTLYEEFSMLSSVALLKQNREIISSYYLREVLNNEIMYVNIRRNMGGAAITRLTLKKIQIIQIPVPPLSLQTQFASIVTKIEEQKALVIKAIDETQYLFDSLMSEYFE